MAYLRTRNGEVVHSYRLGHDPGVVILEHLPEIAFQSGVGDLLGAFSSWVTWTIVLPHRVYLLFQGDYSVAEPVCCNADPR